LRAWACAASLLLAGPALGQETTSRADPAGYRVQVDVAGLDRPWSLAFLPDGRRLVTELPGRLRVVLPDNSLLPEPVAGLPPIHAAGQTGLMEVAVDPDFARNSRIFLSYASGTAAANNTRLASARLVGHALQDVRVLFTADPKSGHSHYGGRIAFPADGTLVLTLGDGFDRREAAQDPATTLGKIVRLHRDGGVPADNPLRGRPGAAPEILSLGHRNVQGVAVDPADGALLVTEHGPRGGDEVNRILPGRNYGWPVATGGLDYTFARVTPFTTLPGFEPPLLEWTPSIAPAGLAVYDGALFPGWRGDLLVPALKERSLRRVRREGGRIVGQEILLAERDQRLRDVRVAPDGTVQLLTDDGHLLRLLPPD
jgi:glucose/arabinose dehydrogenase